MKRLISIQVDKQNDINKMDYSTIKKAVINHTNTMTGILRCRFGQQGEITRVHKNDLVRCLRQEERNLT